MNLIKSKAGTAPFDTDAKDRSTGSVVGSAHVLPLFNEMSLCQSLDKYLDIVTDYTTQTKQDVTKMNDAILYKPINAERSTLLPVQRSGEHTFQDASFHLIQSIQEQSPDRKAKT